MLAALTLLATAGCKQEPTTATDQALPLPPTPGAPLPVESEPADQVTLEPNPGLEEKGRELGQEVREFAEDVKDEAVDAKNEVKDLLQEGQDSAQHKWNERVEALDEKLEDLRHKMDELGDKSSANARESWASIEAERAELARAFEELKTSTESTLQDLNVRIEARVKKLGDAIDAFKEELNK
jgi:DNA repair exonuclease SbcCD ATPase subunit